MGQRPCPECGGKTRILAGNTMAGTLTVIVCNDCDYCENECLAAERQAREEKGRQ